LSEYKCNESNIVDDLMTSKSLSILATYPFASKPKKEKKIRGERKTQKVIFPIQLKRLRLRLFEIK
jgi:hypothetical protein